MTTLTMIESKTVTSQQEGAFSAYSRIINESGAIPTEEGFQSFYSSWCVEEGRFNDIEQSNFNVKEERWDV